jgi:hypothetical protein
MSKLLPGKYNKRWLVFYIVMILVLGAVLTICRISFFKVNITSRSVFSLFIISIVLSSVTSATGFFGLRVICTFSLIGTALGIIFMLYIYSGKTGWEDIAGLLTFIMVYIIFTALGIAVEIIMHYRNK